MTIAVTEVQRNFVIEPYKSHISILVAKGSINQICAWHKFPSPKWGSSVEAAVFERPKGTDKAKFGRWVIALKPDADINVVAHEAMHAALYVAKHHGVPIDYYHDEPLAYLVGYIAELCQRVLDEYNKSAPKNWAVLASEGVIPEPSSSDTSFVRTDYTEPYLSEVSTLSPL